MQPPLDFFFGRAPQRAAGFTLIELMVTLSVLAVLLAAGIPSFTGLLRQWRLEAAVNTLSGDLRLARSNATRTSRHVVVCAQDGGQCSGEETWTQGWLVFIDADSDDALGNGDTVIAQRGPQAGIAAMGLSSSVKHHIRFRPNGTLNGMSATINVQTTGADSKQQDVVINNIGRIHVSSVK